MAGRLNSGEDCFSTLLRVGVVKTSSRMERTNVRFSTLLRVGVVKTIITAFFTNRPMRFSTLLRVGVVKTDDVQRRTSFSVMRVSVPSCGSVSLRPHHGCCANRLNPYSFQYPLAGRCR